MTIDLHRSAPAKINLGLHVLRRRSDGYHDIETVFLRIPWSDQLHASRADELVLTCSDPSLPVDETNLVMKAARALRDRVGGSTDASRGARIHLEKHLPAGAGLGGGSSNAAAALLLLNELWDGRCTHGELVRLAEQLGSDVPFFLGPAAAYGSGRGDVLEELVDPKTDESYRPPYVLVVAVPPVAVATAEAYRLVRPRAGGRPDLREVVLSNDLDRWRRELANDFEPAILQEYPVIYETREALLRSGAGYASLSGSGAAMYGLYEEDDSAEGAAKALRDSGHRVWHGRV